MRRNLFTAWSAHLQQAHVQFRNDLARTEVSTTVYIRNKNQWRYIPLYTTMYQIFYQMICQWLCKQTLENTEGAIKG